MTSTMTWACLPAAALKTAASLPSPASGIVKLLARVSPSGKLMVEDGGVASGSGDGDEAGRRLAGHRHVAGDRDRVVRDRAGPGEPATVKLRATLALKTPVTPSGVRLSTTRSGAIGTYELPPVWSCETVVVQFRPPSSTWFACQTASGTCGSWATPT